MVVCEPRQPALHTIEDLAIGQAFPLLSAPWLRSHERLGLGPDFIGRKQFPARKNFHHFEVFGGTLVAHREGREPVYLVAPEVYAYRPIVGRSEHVDDRTPHGELTAVLHLALSPVTGHAQPGGERGLITLLAWPHDQRLDVIHARSKALYQRPNRGHHDGRPTARLAEPPDRAHTPSHGLHAGAYTLEWQGFPGRKQLHLVFAEEGAEVVGQSLSICRCGCGNEDRTTTPDGGQAGDRDGPSRLGHRQHRGGATEHLKQGRLVSQQQGQIG